MTDYRDDTPLTDAQKASLVGLATAIRTKMYGKDVREAIASAIEMVGTAGVNSYFTPKGVRANLSALENEFPNGTEGIYITEDDGYWNYWNGSQWMKGMPYQSAGDPSEIYKNLYEAENLIADPNFENDGEWAINSNLAKGMIVNGFHDKNVLVIECHNQTASNFYGTFSKAFPVASGRLLEIDALIGFIQDTSTDILAWSLNEYASEEDVSNNNRLAHDSFAINGPAGDALQHYRRYVLLNANTKFITMSFEVVTNGKAYIGLPNAKYVDSLYPDNGNYIKDSNFEVLSLLGPSTFFTDIVKNYENGNALLTINHKNSVLETVVSQFVPVNDLNSFNFFAKAQFRPVDSDAGCNIGIQFLSTNSLSDGLDTQTGVSIVTLDPNDSSMDVPTVLKHCQVPDKTNYVRLIINMYKQGTLELLEPTIVPDESSILSQNELPHFEFSGDMTGMTHDNAKMLRFIYVNGKARYTGYANVKYQGDSSSATGAVKHNYGIKCFSDSALKNKLNFKPKSTWPSSSSWVLKADLMDNSHVRNVVNAKLFGKVIKSQANYIPISADLMNYFVSSQGNFLIPYGNAQSNSATGVIKTGCFRTGTGFSASDIFEHTSDGLHIKVVSTPTDKIRVLIRQTVRPNQKYTLAFDSTSGTTVDVEATYSNDYNVFNDATAKTTIATGLTTGTRQSVSFDIGEYNTIDFELKFPATVLDVTLNNFTLKIGLDSNYIPNRLDTNSLPLSQAANQGMIDGFPIECFNNGASLGLYNFTIKKSKDMLNIDNSNPLQEGIEVEENNDYATFNHDSALFDGTDFSPVVQDKFTDTFKIHWNALMALVNSGSDADVKAQLPSKIDILGVIDRVIFEVLSQQWDSEGKSQMFVTYNDGGFIIPLLYDFDSTWGLHYDGATMESAFDSFALSNKLSRRVVQIWHDEFISRYKYLRQNILSNQNLIDNFVNYTKQIDSYYFDVDKLLYPSIYGIVDSDVHQIVQNIQQQSALLDQKIL